MGLGGQIPEKVGGYEILLQIARGGMATVYLARAEAHAGLDRYVALKLTAEHLRGDPDFAQHLVEEARLVANLRHTNVVPVLDVGADDRGAVFLVMEYVPGDSLGGLVRSAKKASSVVPSRVGMRVLLDALAGLHAAHEHADEDGTQHQLVHRDFSPQNILVGTDGIARLTDFGIAKAASRASVTAAGTMKGKISYASPEQARGERIDRRCDVWAAGIVAWEVLAGRKLHPSKDRSLLDVVKGPPPRIRTVVPDIPGDLDEAIAYALQLEAADRPATAEAFARLLGTAARSANLVADLDEVAHYVQIAVAPVLEERKQKVAEARRVRALASAERADAAPDGSNETNEAELLPSLPQIPMVTRPLADGPTVPASVADQLLSSGEIPASPPASGEAHDAQPMLEGELRPSDRALDRRDDAWATPPPMSAIRSSFSSIQDLKQSVVDRVARFIARRPALVIGGASAITTVLLLGAVLIATFSSGPTADASANAVASGPAPRESRPLATALPRSPSEPTTASLAQSSSLGEPAPLPTQLQLAANQPIARVKIGKRSVDVEVPAPSVAIDLTPAESKGHVAVVATTSDGRSATGRWNPGDSSVNLSFDDYAPPAASGAAKPARAKPKPKPKPKKR